MRLPPFPSTDARRSTSAQCAEIWLALAFGVLAALAVWLPAAALPAHYHDFADQRTLWGLPCAMDVLSNLSFAFMGVFVLWRLMGKREQLSKTEYQLTGLTAVGLLATALCSSIYHLHPDAAGLALDRAGMGVAFAGVLGLAAATRITPRAGWGAAAVVALLAPLAAVWDWRTGNMTPWSVLQGGGLALLLALACRPLSPRALPFSLWPVLALYAIAKALELADVQVLAATHGLISGHTAKHLVAALAAAPLLLAFHRMAPHRPAGTIRPATHQKKVHA